jgi:hypothetical protein
MHSVEDLYIWSCEQLRKRSLAKEFRAGMPDESREVAIHVSRRGGGAHIRFSLLDTLEDAAEGIPVIVRVNYEDGYAIFGMPESYTIGMLAVEFMTLVPSRWGLPLS